MEGEREGGEGWAGGRPEVRGAGRPTLADQCAKSWLGSACIGVKRWGEWGASHRIAPVWPAPVLGKLHLMVTALCPQGIRKASAVAVALYMCIY